MTKQRDEHNIYGCAQVNLLSGRGGAPTPGRDSDGCGELARGSAYREAVARAPQIDPGGAS